VLFCLVQSEALWRAKPENYLVAGSYCAWNTNVDLSPPPSYGGPVLPEDDTFLQYYYSVLQYILYETGFPETVDETRNAKYAEQPSDTAASRTKMLDDVTDQTENADSVTIAVLSNPIELIGMLVEGWE
jgi:hypothetical protein